MVAVNKKISLEDCKGKCEMSYFTHHVPVVQTSYQTITRRLKLFSNQNA